MPLEVSRHAVQVRPVGENALAGALRGRLLGRDGRPSGLHGEVEARPAEPPPDVGAAHAGDRDVLLELLHSPASLSVGSGSKNGR